MNIFITVDGRPTHVNIPEGITPDGVRLNGVALDTFKQITPEEAYAMAGEYASEWFEGLEIEVPPKAKA